MADGFDTSKEFGRGYIHRRAATFHEAFGVESHFNTVMSKYESTEEFDLEQTLKQFQNQSPDESDFDFDLQQCNWHDVFRELGRAQTAASESERHGKKIHRKAWRAFGNIGDMLAPGLVAIPNNLCVLQGGLAVIFSIARHRVQDREKILRSFEDIPNIIIMAYGKAANIPRDRSGSDRLHGMIRALQKTLLEALPLLIDRLNPGTFFRKAMSPLKSYDTDEILAGVRSQGERVRVCAEEIMESIIVSSHQTMQNNLEVSRDIRMTTHKTEGEVEELRGKVNDILKHQKSFQNALAAVSGQNSLLSFLTEILKKSEPLVEKPSRESLPVEEPGTPFTPIQLLRLMNVDALLALDDERHIIGRRNSLGREAIARAATMFQTTQVQQLIHSPESCCVLVNGCTDRSQNTKVSPVTHVCATFTHALRCANSANVVLGFFCGQHSTSNDDLKGPQGLMRSLVAFLILSLLQNSCISDSAPISFPALEGGLEALSFKDVCQLFYHLIELVPQQITVYCIIDGISYYEMEGWEGDYDLIMRCFSSIIANETNAAFKLLLTSPTKSRWLPNAIMPYEPVSLRNLRMRGAANAENYLQSAFENLLLPEDS